MNKYLWAAIEAVLEDAEQDGALCERHVSHLAVLKIEFEKECRKHGKFPRRSSQLHRRPL